MTGSRTDRIASRAGIPVAVLAAALAFMAILGSGSASAAGFQEGRIIVAPQSQSVNPHTAVRPTDGTAVPVWDILEEAAGAGAIDLDSFPRLTIAGRTLSHAQVEGAGPSLNVVFEPDQTTINLPGGGKAVYGEGEQFAFTPKIVVFPKATNFQVTLSPKARTVKTGTTVRFRATVTGTTGTLTYSWSFGDGSADRQTTGPATSHTFRGNDEQFAVTLIVTEAGNARQGTGASLITVGRVRKPEKQEKKPEKKETQSTPAPGGAPDDGGYGDYGGGSGGGYGDGYGSPSAPSAPASPAPEKKEKPRPVDDGLVPVRGELLDPDIPAQVIDPSTPQPESGPSAGPDPEESGFALSGGAKTAIGIAVLLGLGVLTELRSFARLR